MASKMQEGSSKVSKSQASALYQTPGHSNVSNSVQFTSHVRYGSNAFNTNRKNGSTINNQNSKPQNLKSDLKLK